MGKGGWLGTQIVGMVAVAVFAQAAIRSLFDHSATQLWGAFDWVPGEWGGRLIVFLLLAAVGVVLAGWAHDRGKQVSR
ncbi:hypothetical protein ACFWMR_33580 [Amycolatopsis thailandensis]|uniref:Uncharacterized protein n=1 Tax=Amycolatopsis thailandensis TaxID=589330 RepID=A0A229S9N9_9PSEU|nr:hypothetical protein [Amycolatopsis thailandensis]OXM55656.1 hypothetical protein CFP71_16835 [Amycolatopsis thailandensis]